MESRRGEVEAALWALLLRLAPDELLHLPGGQCICGVAPIGLQYEQAASGHRGEDDIGFIRVDVEVSNPANLDVRETVRMLVDTGAMFSVLPSGLLNRLGVHPIQRRRFRGFGSVLTRDIGNAVMRYDDCAAGVTVIFGEEDDPPVMGVTSLESLGFEVDPVGEKLNRVELLLL